MTTLDDLRQVLEEDAGLAPDGAGLVQAAHLGAANLRRRRRLVAVTAAAALVAAVAVVTPIVVHRAAGKPVTPAVSPTARKPGDMTLTVDPRVRMTVLRLESWPDRQILSLENRDKPGETPVQFSVEAWDPDVENIPKAGRPAEHITIQGRDAQFWSSVSPIQLARDARPTLLWQDPSGLWIEVIQNDGVYDRARLIGVAEAARIGPPRPVTAPFRLAPLPAGLRLNSIGFNQDGDNGATTTMLFLPPGATTDVHAFRVTAFPKGGVARPAWLPRRPTTPVAGHQAWYTDGLPGAGWLTMDAGACWVQFNNVPPVTVSQLRKLAAGTAYGDCDDQSTWTPPLG